jgi:hypothetical protein
LNKFRFTKAKQKLKNRIKKIDKKKIDGVAMGSSLGPLFANIFLSFHEKKWLNNCPDSFKSIFSAAMLMTRLYCLTHVIILFLSLITLTETPLR